MKILIMGGRVFRADRTFADQCPILLEDGQILAVGKNCDAVCADRVLDATGYTVLPGLVDVHTHGRMGFDFCGATAEEMRLMRADYARRGVTTVMATLASGTREEWINSIAAIEESGFDGIHFEGRYLNPAKRGAHAAHLLGALDANELDSFLKLVHIPCHVSAALELDADGSFSKKVLEHGATLGLGHTCATAADARMAIARGATSFTHLFNAMPPLHHREGGAVAVALNGGGYGEIIADGVHICADVVRLAYRSLGPDKTVLITDSMAGTGCPDGNYSIAGMPVLVKDGRALTTDGAIAGSTLNLWDGVKNLMHMAGIGLADAVACATVNPARMVGLDDRVGRIEVGLRADLLLVNGENEICHVIACGREIA
ncbi:MAG: N-acetylglucosamine-6-phosphate deacetylase [Clostridia bacterium]|nr:N-acetylglucosamine-6-phosphate deacetylase [Clostridia bacterium]